MLLTGRPGWQAVDDFLARQQSQDSGYGKEDKG